DDCSVELDQQLLRQVVLPEQMQEVHPLLGLLDDGVDVGFTVLLSMVRGGSAGELLLKSTVISTVLSVFSSRLLRPHHRTSCSTSRLYADSSSRSDEHTSELQ